MNPSQSREQWDVVIIGSGAGGGAAALRLSQHGLRVLVLEKGPAYQSQQYVHDELDMLIRPFFTPDPGRDPHMVVTPQTQTPVRHKLGWSASCVGGGTEHMGAYLYRFHPDDFNAQSRYGSYQELADWPFGYEELEPYYAQAEAALGVSGDSSDQAAYVARSAPYPLPALKSHPIADSLDDCCAALGLHSFPTPRSVNSRPYGGRPACQHCQHCGSYGCPTGARGTSMNSLLKPAQNTGKCEVRSLCMVVRLDVDPENEHRLASCQFRDHNGQLHRAFGRYIILACAAVETARLLLASAEARYPTGLANRSGHVGKHLQLHAVSIGWAEFSGQHPLWLKADDAPDISPMMGRSLYDFYHLPDGVAPITQGGILRFSRATAEPISDAINTCRQDLSQEKQMLWGEALVQGLHQHYRHQRRLAYEVFHNFIPNSATYVSLDPEVKDPWGLPVARINLSVDPHQKACGQWIVEQTEKILHCLKPSRIFRSVVGGTTWHLSHGTCRASTHPADGVVNAECRSHDIHNLFIADASFMPTAGVAPPTLTIVANALRVADIIQREMNTGSDFKTSKQMACA